MQAEAKDRAARRLRGWHGSAIHRTGTAGDHAGAARPADEAKSRGGHVSQDRTRRPLEVMTPHRSWWQSTAERGGGLVCWLETLHAVLRAELASDVVFTAGSGRELDRLGLDEFVGRRRGWDDANGATWVHHGANIGAAGGNTRAAIRRPPAAGKLALTL